MRQTGIMSLAGLVRVGVWLAKDADEGAFCGTDGEV